MKRLLPLPGSALLAAQTLLAAVPLQAEPFGLVDLGTLAPAGGVQGPVSIGDDLVLYLDEADQVAVCDGARGRNLADLVIELQMAQTVLLACPGLTNPSRTGRVAAMRALALPRYANRAGVEMDAVVTAFEARANDEIALVTRCGVRANEIVADVVEDWFETRLREAMEPQRMPAISCPRDLQ